MADEVELPEPRYLGPPSMVVPSRATPRHTLYLSPLDNQAFLRFSIKYLYLFRRAPPSTEALRASLGRVLVDYYPLAGRLRGGTGKLELDCTGEGAAFAEASLELDLDALLRGCTRPGRSWRKLMYKFQASTFADVPPLVIQVTHLRCGGMALTTAICHCLCDGIGTAQFLQAWSAAAAASAASPVPAPFNDRHPLRPRNPTLVAFTHPEYHRDSTSTTLPQLLLAQQPLRPVAVTFTSADILRIKHRCSPPPCTSFEAVAAVVWRAWAASIAVPPAKRVKLLFSVNVRKKLKPELPRGYYGNAFVLGCAEAAAGDLDDVKLGVKLVREAKECVDDEYIRSLVDLLEEKPRLSPDLSATLVITAWTRLGLEDVEFGAGKPVHVGPLTSEIHCVFAPLASDPAGMTAMVSVPQGAAELFEGECLAAREENGVAL